MAIYKPRAGGDFHLEAALGHVSNYRTVNKFGVAPDADTVITDLWDGADGVTSTDVWVAPTQARLHDIASTDAADAVAGTGAQTVQIFGLTAWDAAQETTEVVSLVSAGDAETVNAYVIIYRMKVIRFGSGRANAGKITATAQTDSTITAIIHIGNGQTLMAIYAIPSTKRFAVEFLHAYVKANSSAIVQGSLLVAENADATDPGFVVKRQWEFRRDDRLDLTLDPPMVFEGPCIIKMQVLSDTINVVVGGDFDGFIVDKRT